MNLPTYALNTQHGESVHFFRILQEFHCPSLTLKDLENTHYWFLLEPVERKRVSELMDGHNFPDDFPDAQSEWLRMTLGL